jgi:excisionase family DNA binding protein
MTPLRLLTVKDVAARLQVKPKTLYAWASEGKIPTIKINGVIRFDADEIEAWLEKCQVSVGPPARTKRAFESKNGVMSIDSLIERAKRAVYTNRGETRPIASPKRGGT